MFTIHRFEQNPILSPLLAHPWEAEATFNGSPIKIKGDIHLLYRAMSRPELLGDRHISRSIIGKAISQNGSDFTDRRPFITPEYDFEILGCEDPRVTKFEGKYYIFYTALSGYPFKADNIKVAIAISDDMETVTQKHLVTPFNAKAMSLFPERINGKIYAILTADTDRPNTKIAIAEFDTLEQIWSPEFWNDWYQNIDKHTIIIPHSDNEQVEIGAPPIKTDHGWLLIYSHIQQYRSGTPIFGVQSLLLNINNPKTIIGNTDKPFMVPELYYEKIGMVSRIIFPTGGLVREDILDIYYGGADTHCCKASVNLSELLFSMSPEGKEMVERFPSNPILAAREGVKWEARGVFNPAAIELDGVIHILYRAMSDDDTSTIGYATTIDGTTIVERSSEPIYNPRGQYETKQHPGNSGCEDARIILIDDTLHIFYTAYNGVLPRIATSSISKKNFLTKNWDKWTNPQLVTPVDIDNKDGCIVPEKTEKGYVMLHRVGNSICGDIFKTLDFSKEQVNRCIEILSPRPGMWDSKKVGISGPPIKTEGGWLLLYHGVSENSVYSVGVALLNLKDPTIVLSRCALPIFEPRESYEKIGVIPNVVFPCGAVKRDDTLFIYYGGADTVVGVATAKISSLLKILS